LTSVFTISLVATQTTILLQLCFVIAVLAALVPSFHNETEPAMRASLTAVVVLIATPFIAGCAQSTSPTAPSSALSSSSLSTAVVVGQDVGQPGQVRICHFNGHESPEGQHDFVTGDGPQHGGTPVVCNTLGGLAMWVSPQACKEGHGAVNILGTDCDAQH